MEGVPGIAGDWVLISTSSAGPHPGLDTTPVKVSPDATFIHGDCLTALREMDPAGVDVVITSPPYNIGINYSDSEDTMPPAQYLEFMRELAEELRRVVKADGHVFLNVGYTCKEPWKAMDVAMQFRRIFLCRLMFFFSMFI